MRRLPKLTDAQRLEIDEARKARVGRAIERAQRGELAARPLPAPTGRWEAGGDAYALDPDDKGRITE